MLVDDHEVVREGLRTMVESEDDMEVVVEADSADEAVRRAKTFEPDVVVLDVRLPDRSGVLACRDIRSELPETQVLMLTSFSDDQALFDSIMAGAAGYLLKQIRGDDLLESIRRVAAGESMLDPSVTERVLERIRHPEEEQDAKLARLTPTEVRITELMAEGLTNREIGERLHLAEKTIKNYASTIFSKLEVSRRAEAAAYIAEDRARREQRS